MKNSIIFILDSLIAPISVINKYFIMRDFVFVCYFGLNVIYCHANLSGNTLFHSLTHCEDLRFPIYKGQKNWMILKRWLLMRFYGTSAYRDIVTMWLTLALTEAH